MENVTEILSNYISSSEYYDTVGINSTTQSIEQRMKVIFREPLNIILLLLCFAGLFANILSIAATLHIPHGQTAHSKLIINLAVSDVCIILTVLLQVLEKILSPLHPHEFCIENASQGFLHFALTATLINLLAMAIDHYVAILNPMHYHEIMSHFRANLMIFLIWIISVIGGLLDFIVGAIIDDKSDADFCLKVYTDKFESQILLLCLILLELFVLIYLYLRIFLEVKKLLARGQAMHQDDLHSNKAIITTLLIIGTFMICWVPNSLYQITMYVWFHVDPVSLRMDLNTYVLIHTILWILMLSNSLCDPIIYALRLRDIQRGYNRMLKKLCKMEKYGFEESRVHSRRHTGKVYMSETDLNEQFAVSPNDDRNGELQIKEGLNELTMMYSNTEEENPLLPDIHTNTSNGTDETDNSKDALLLSCNTDTMLTCDDKTESDFTDLTPESTTNQPFQLTEGRNENL